MAENDIVATGRRKTAVARVRLQPGGEGSITVNKKPFDSYFCTDVQRAQVQFPLKTVEKLKAVTIKARVDGGGHGGVLKAEGFVLAFAEVGPDVGGGDGKRA